ncbi:unnamed protein product [Spirodela intermedia]|uniref:DYW domain-containing protein n=1 Tax=Spirodela intermedia TaxID=51605 RepID=A0A7I8JS07_SPIIN|nr:unnamed protein product [Spirodela intermedia]CAA6672919.1 unnamed protein product [Spirodela intermedia]
MDGATAAAPFLLIPLLPDESAAIKGGQQIHGYIVRSGIPPNFVMNNSLISMYSRNRSMDLARRAFDSMENPNVVSWNSIISGYALNGDPDEAWKLFEQMTTMHDVKPDLITWNSLISGNVRHGCNAKVLELFKGIQSSAIAESRTLELGRQIHGYAIRHGHDSSAYVGTSTIDMYVKCGDLGMARRVFDCMPHRNLFAWNSLISGYAFQGLFDEALLLLNQMQQEGIRPDLTTWNGLISGYSMKGFKKQALILIRRLKTLGEKPNVISWTSVISGFCQNGFFADSLGCFVEMQKEGVQPNSATMASSLRAAAGLALLTRGEISTAAQSGGGSTGISSSPPPSLTCIPSAGICRRPSSIRHGERGWRFFDMMKVDYAMIPSPEHYACMVDLLGRAGYLDEAWDFIENMPQEPDAGVWGALLGACRSHKNLELAEAAAEQLFKLEPHNPANYLLMASIYGSRSQWERVETLKVAMSALGLKSRGGWSWIQIRKTLHSFSAEGNPHPDLGEVRFELLQMVAEMKRIGYRPDTACIALDVDEATKEMMLMGHTEKLAITYGLFGVRSVTDCHRHAPTDAPVCDGHTAIVGVVGEGDFNSGCERGISR